LVSDWHILRSAAFGNAGISAVDLNWAYKFDTRDNAHSVRHTEAYARLAANPKASFATLDSLIKNENDYTVVNIAEMAKKIREAKMDTPISDERWSGLSGGVVYSSEDYKLGAQRLIWVLCGAPYDANFLYFLKMNVIDPMSLNDVISKDPLRGNAEFKKYSPTLRANANAFFDIKGAQR
jgi:hypothetical protein